ncbi:MAG: hypothetical protein IMW92_08700 [Bacillales bacterium]|nr:hypothetical protein [Bacillales bacterium]
MKSLSLEAGYGVPAGVGARKKEVKEEGIKRRHVFQLRKHAFFLKKNILNNGCDGDGTVF